MALVESTSQQQPQKGMGFINCLDDISNRQLPPTYATFRAFAHSRYPADALEIRYFGDRLEIAYDLLTLLARLPQDVINTYGASTAYASFNDTEADEFWDALDINPIAIALSDEYARAQGLPPADRFPWDDGKGLYYLKGFHDLHCVKLLRRSILEYRSSTPQTVPGPHVAHCLDTLRQAVQCAADDLPMATIPGQPHKTGDGDMMRCRSWDALARWARDPERDACFDVIDEYKPLKAGIERFAFCKKGSRYWGRMQSFFEKWGHSDSMWEDVK